MQGATDRINQIRYYYCMVMASILGLSIVEILDRRTVAAEWVKANNAKYIKLLKI